MPYTNTHRETQVPYLCIFQFITEVPENKKSEKKRNPFRIIPGQTGGIYKEIIGLQFLIKFVLEVSFFCLLLSKCCGLFILH